MTLKFGQDSNYSAEYKTVTGYFYTAEASQLYINYDGFSCEQCVSTNIHTKGI